MNSEYPFKEFLDKKIRSRFSRNKEITLVYKITNIHNKKSYVGITNTIFRRMTDHLKGKDNNSAIHHALKKYGINSFVIKILKVTQDRTVALDEERKYIAKFDTRKNGYNLTEGGDGFGLRYGEDAPGAVLTSEEVAMVRFSVIPLTWLSLMLGITVASLSKIRLGESWSHVNVPEYDTTLKENEVLDIVHDERTNKEIADSYGFPQVWIERIKNPRGGLPVYETKWKKIPNETKRIIIEDKCSHIEASEKYGISYRSIKYIRRGSKVTYNNGNYTAGITPEILKDIIADSSPHTEIAKKYGISRTTVSSIRTGKLYPKAERSSTSEYRSGRTNINEDLVKEIFLADGSTKDISKKYGVSYGCVYKIKKGFRWKSVTESISQNTKYMED